MDMDSDKGLIMAGLVLLAFAVIVILGFTSAEATQVDTEGPPAEAKPKMGKPAAMWWVLLAVGVLGVAAWMTRYTFVGPNNALKFDRWTGEVKPAYTAPSMPGWSLREQSER
ncbi:MAG: hypothetical protein HC888_11240 [Candidatus Competibacteraceae bacterium]|nr:hypothetical protein [Candidatus Competibacteraceae bacterium]